MRAAFRTNSGTTERAIINPRQDFMGAVTVVKGTHNLKVFLPTFRAGCLIDNKVTGVTLVSTLSTWNIIEMLIFLCNFSLVCGPFHTIR
jgi:hypothetical protein